MEAEKEAKEEMREKRTREEEKYDNETVSAKRRCIIGGVS